jgi:hypothetical protein
MKIAVFKAFFIVPYHPKYYEILPKRVHCTPKSVLH